MRREKNPHPRLGESSARRVAQKMNFILSLRFKKRNFLSKQGCILKSCFFCHPRNRKVGRVILLPQLLG